MLTRVSSPRSGRPSEGSSVATSVHDRLRGASSAPDSRTTPCRHAGSGTKRGSGDRRVAPCPRGATGHATSSPLRPKASANGQTRAGNRSNCVFVLNAEHRPLMPCHPARARELLKKDRAVMVRLHPFTIRLTNRIEGETQAIILGIDPGSQVTGLALARMSGETRWAIWLGTLQHRGAQIRKKLEQRRHYRRRRRSANLRYRAPRFQNRRRQEDWLPPSLQHRVDTTTAWVARLQRWVPITTIVMELVKFDTQALQDPEISGLEYQQGTLCGYEVREYLLEKWGRQCVYCRKTQVSLQLEHIVPTSRGGSDRVSNLALACARCNQEKGSQTAAEYGYPDVHAQALQSLRDAAAVNSTRWALYRGLQSCGLPLATGTGGRTKWNRTRFVIPKTHALDALCVGAVEAVSEWRRTPLTIRASGRGAYQRTRVTAHGFPRGQLMRHKMVQGFRTGDFIRAVVPRGRHQGTHTGRVAVRSSGSFNLHIGATTLQGIHYRHCRLLMRADGYTYLTSQDAPPPRPEGRGVRCRRNWLSSPP